MPSRTISRHHWYIVSVFVNRPIRRSEGELKWNHMAKPDVISRADKAPVSGHGLGLTM